MNNLNISEEKLGALLAMAGQKLGQDPQQLREKLESGKLNEITDNLDPGTVKKINTMLQNPKMLETMLGNEKVRSMLGGLLNNQK